MTKILPRKHVAQVNLNERNINGEQRIAQCDAGVRERARVEQYERRSVLAGRLDAVDEFVFGIALDRVEFVPRRGRLS